MIFRPYGIFIALAVLAGIFWTRREVKRAGQDPEKVWDMAPWVLVGGLVGARLYHVAHYWGYYAQDFWRILQVWHGGLAIYGGLLGGFFGLLVFVKLVKLEELGRWLELAAPGVALGQAVGRLGNVVNGELLPFAYYELVWDLVVFVLLVKYRRGSNATNLLHKLTTNEKIICGLFVKGIRGVGSTFSLYLLLYALGRFFLEFLRTDNVWRWGSLTAAQEVSLGLISLICLICLISLMRRFGRAEGK